MTWKLSDLKQEKNADPSSKMMAHPFLLAHSQKIKAVKDLMQCLPNPGEAYLLFSIGQFNKFSLILWVLQQIEVIEQLHISTYSMTTAMLESLSNLMQTGKVGSVSIFISDSIKFRLPKVSQCLDSMAQVRPDKFKVTYCWNHSKVCLIRTGQLSLVIEGSGNFSENAAMEQYIVINSLQAYEFRLNALLGAPIK
jgi:hypothetical protein